MPAIKITFVKMCFINKKIILGELKNRKCISYSHNMFILPTNSCYDPIRREKGILLYYYYGKVL
jgi:hypothetical protein